MRRVEHARFGRPRCPPRSSVRRSAAAAPERVHHPRVPLGLHADDPHLGPECLHRDCDARDQAAAADRDDDRVERVRLGLVEELEADGALARDDERVVERGDERRAGLVRDALRARERARVVGALEHDLARRDARCSTPS